MIKLSAYRYDALNRLRQKSTFKNYQNVLSYSTSYTYDKMGNILTLNRFASNAPMDSLQYFYNAGTNQLNHVRDKINASNFPNDIDNQNPGNYAYDPTGNLIKDQAENLCISWTHYGKVKQINKNNTPLLSFEYDATGNRLIKDNLQTKEKQIYIRDAQGNVMAVYQARNDSLFLDELHLYGSSRLGMIKEQQFLTKKLTGGTPPPPQISPVYTLKLYSFGKKHYELTDWLGNVRVVINDKKTPMGTNPQNMTYQAQTISVSDYYPFGMLARNYNVDKYRFGFNGGEKLNTIYGQGNYVDLGKRGVNVRLGRLNWRIDPFADKIPSVSPYAFVDNNPIIFIDAEGSFRMSPRQQRKYPQLTNMLKNIQQTVHNDPKTYAAFKETLGLTDEQANEILEWGKGPKVKVGWTPQAYGKTNGRGNIKLYRKMIKVLEGQRDNPITKEGLVFLIYATVLHEGQHSAEVLFDKTLLKEGEVYDPNSTLTEAGNVFEQKAFGDIINTGNADVKNQENRVERSIPLIMERGKRGGEMKGNDKPENQQAAPLSKELGIEEK